MIRRAPELDPGTFWRHEGTALQSRSTGAASERLAAELCDEAAALATPIACYDWS
jgi:hypothetical protein